MSQIFTDDEIIAETPRQKRMLQILRWVTKILVTILTAATTTIATGCALT